MLPENIGRYQIKEELGRGQSTVVYRAFDTEANREVAVKVLAVEQAPDISQRAHFKRELKMIASLEHPAIVPVYDVGEHNGQPYFVMRYMAGGSLTQLLASKGKLPLQDTAHIIGRICAASTTRTSRTSFTATSSRITSSSTSTTTRTSPILALPGPLRLATLRRAKDRSVPPAT